MTDRLPEPMSDSLRGARAERASASPPRVGTRGARVAAVRPDVATTAASEAGAVKAFRETPRNLASVEEWMVGAIVSTEDPLGVDRVLTEGPRQTASERFEIYRSGYRARLVECLEDDYPVLAGTLGRDRFESLCRAYVDRHPSTSPNLNVFGRHMAAFCLEARDAGDDGNARFYAELAALEWAVVEAIHAETNDTFDGARLKDLEADEWSAIVFVPNDAVKLLKFEFPVNAFYQAVRTGPTPPVPTGAASATVVYRRGLTVWRMDLTPAMTRVLDALLAGLPLGDALSTIGVDEADDGAVKEAERSVMVWFREWVSSGFFRDFSLAATSGPRG